jgi:hypothetical protein
MIFLLFSLTRRQEGKGCRHRFIAILSSTARNQESPPWDKRANPAYLTNNSQIWDHGLNNQVMVYAGQIE